MVGCVGVAHVLHRVQLVRGVEDHRAGAEPPKHAVEVGPQGRPPLFVGQRGHRHVVRRPGAVADDEDVEPAQGTRGLVHGAPGGDRISQVGLDRDRPDRPDRPLPPFATHCRPGRFFSVRPPVPIPDRHRAACPREHDRGRPTDTAAAAGHESPLAVQGDQSPSSPSTISQMMCSMARWSS